MKKSSLVLVLSCVSAVIFATNSWAVGKAAVQAKPIVDVQIEKKSSVDFMANHWKWPSPDKWEDLLKARIEGALAVLGASKSFPAGEVTAKFGWITAVSFSYGGGLGGAVKSKDGKYQMQYAEVSLEGKLKAKSLHGQVVEIPFIARSLMFSPSEDFIPNLFDAAVLYMVSGLPASQVDQNVTLNWVWERRQELPQSVTHRHIEPNAQAKEGDPNEVVFEVTEPGPMIWDAVLRISTQESLNRVLNAIVGADTDIQMAIALAVKKACAREDFRVLLDSNKDAFMATFDKIAKEPREVLQDCLVVQESQ